MKSPEQIPLFTPVVIEGTPYDEVNGCFGIVTNFLPASHGEPDTYTVRFPKGHESLPFYPAPYEQLSIRKTDQRLLELPADLLTHKYQGIPCSKAAYGMNKVTDAEHRKASVHIDKKTFAPQISQAFTKHFSLHPFPSGVIVIIAPGPGYDLDILLQHTTPSKTDSLVLIEPMVCYHDELLAVTAKHGYTKVQIIHALVEEIPTFVHKGKNGHPLPINWWFCMDFISGLKHHELRQTIKALNAPGIAVTVNRPLPEISQDFSPNVFLIPQPYTPKDGHNLFEYCQVVITSGDNKRAKELQETFDPSTRVVTDGMITKFKSVLRKIKEGCRYEVKYATAIQIFCTTAGLHAFEIIPSQASSYYSEKTTRAELRKLILAEKGLPNREEIAEHPTSLGFLSALGQININETPEAEDQITRFVGISMFNIAKEPRWEPLSQAKIEEGILLGIQSAKNASALGPS